MAQNSLIPTTESQRTSLSLRDVADTLFRQKGLILPLFVLLIGATALAIYFRPEMYESEMVLLVKNERVDAIVAPGNTSEPAGRGEVGEAQIATEIQLLSGKELFRDVARQCGLAALNPADTPETRALLVEKAANKLQKEVKISPVLKANMIRVTYSARNPALAALVLQVLADRYMNRHLKVHSASGTYEFFDRQTRLFEKQLGEAQARLAQFQQRTKIVMLSQQKEMNLRKLVDVAAVLQETHTTQNETKQRIAMLRSDLAGMTSRIRTQSRNIPNQYSVERLNTMLIELQNKRTELLTKYLPGDRLVRQMDQQIADTKAALDRAGTMASNEETTDVNPLRQTLTAELAQSELNANGLQARSESLARHVEEYQTELAKLERAAADDGNLNRLIKDSEDNYLLYARKREEARITDALDKQKIANVAVAEPSSIPLLPQPRVSGVSITGFLLCSALILGSAFLIGVRRKTVYTPWELEGLTYVPVLATVPSQPGVSTRQVTEVPVEWTVQDEENVPV